MVALPSSPLTIRRDLHDGARYEVAAAAPGLVTLLVIDADGDAAPITVDRAGARQLIEDITLAAGLTPTGPKLGRAGARPRWPDPRGSSSSGCASSSATTRPAPTWSSR